MKPASPHIAVNTRLLLSHRLEGIGRFAYEVLSRMVQNNPDVRFSFFFDRKYDPAMVMGSNVTPYVLPPQARHPVLWHTWFHLVLPMKMRQIKPDLFFSPEFYLTGAKNIPQIPVFHDIAYEHYPKDIARFASWHCRTFSPKYAEKAAQILTVSEFSKQDIINEYGTLEDKISVVYNGASKGFKSVSADEQQQIREKYTDGNPYFHFVGTIQPRKNLENLLRAFDHFKTQQASPVKLLLVGRKGWQYAGAMETYEAMHYKEDVIFTGFVPDEELNSIYGASLALCYVPYFEGFGIPILEAMHSETAVICSDAASMPEVAGEAAMMVDPFSPEAIAYAMKQLWLDPQYRTVLIEKGRLQREKFSWERTYDLVWAELSQYIGGSS
jgi:glycosyltransferase involved in cell wall biosynthesis